MIKVCSITIFLQRKEKAISIFQVAQKKRKIKCPMCRLWIASKIWHNGKHREMCAKKNEYFIRQLPEPFDIRCPTCLKYLKLMPKVSTVDFRNSRFV